MKTTKIILGTIAVTLSINVFTASAKIGNFAEQKLSKTFSKGKDFNNNSLINSNPNSKFGDTYSAPKRGKPIKGLGL